MGRDSVFIDFTSSTEMRHSPALPLPALTLEHGQYFHFLFPISITSVAAVIFAGCRYTSSCRLRYSGLFWRPWPCSASSSSSSVGTGTGAAPDFWIPRSPVATTFTARRSSASIKWVFPSEPTGHPWCGDYWRKRRNDDCGISTSSDLTCPKNLTWQHLTNKNIVLNEKRRRERGSQETNDCN